MSSIENFKSRLVGGGARANLFRVNLDWPTSNQTERETAQFLAKATTLPASTIENIDVAFRGRMLKVPGDRTFENWSVTVINDNDMSIRKGMEEWMSLINNHEANFSAFAIDPLGPRGFYKTLSVEQLNKQGATIRSYEYRNAYPVSVSSIDLAYDKNNEVEEFTVEFAYSYWLAADTLSGIRPAFL